MAGKRKAAALALLSGYASGSGSGGSGSDAPDSEQSASEDEQEGPVLGPAGPPPADEAREEGPAAGPAWRPADGDYEELPEPPPEDEEEEEAARAAGGAAEAPAHVGSGECAAAPRPRFVSVPASLAALAPPLPPPPDEPCAPELQAKLARFHALQQAGRSINAELRKSKGYRNPDFLQKIVEHFGIREHGSGYPKQLFDPEGLPAEDYVDALAAAQRRLAEAREAERARRGAVDFAPGGVQAGTGAYAAMAVPPAPAAPAAAAPYPPHAPAPVSLRAPGGRASRWDPSAPAAAESGLAAAMAAAAAINASLQGRGPPPPH